MALPGTPTLTIPCVVCKDGRFNGRAATARYFQRTGDGIAFLSTGDQGTSNYTNNATRKTIADDIYDDGHSVVTIQWKVQGDFGGILKDQAGKGYRFAYGFGWRSVVQFVGTQITMPSKIVAAGNSGGGGQAIYAAQGWYADHSMAGIVASGGPPTILNNDSASCIGATRTDYLLGFTTGSCNSNTLTDDERERFAKDMITGGRLDFKCPIVIVNAEDNTSDSQNGRIFARKAKLAGANVTVTEVAGSSHEVDTTSAGAAAISSAILDLLN